MRRRSDGLRRDLARLLDAERTICPVPPDSPYNEDMAGRWRGLRGGADAVALPDSVGEVAALVGYCGQEGLPLVPRGGGSGVCGGACPTEGGVVCCLERLGGVASLDVGGWTMRVGAGLSTAHVRRLARENGLLYGPDPGAGEQSQIGGNVATDAGGPHALKYGSTRHWVTGVEAVLGTGEVVRFGGGASKEAACYDVVGLLAGSEGTLGVLTAVELALLPARAAALALVAFAEGVDDGCGAVADVLGSGVVPAALELLEGEALHAVGGAYGRGVPDGAGAALVVEVDGSVQEAAAARAELAAVLGGCVRVDAHDDVGELWRWRGGVSGALAGICGGKLSEDVVVPRERLGELLAGFGRAAAGEGLRSCCFGHAGDGNMHATLLLDPREREALAAGERVLGRLFELVVGLGGSISGEHGLGVVKRDALALQCSAAELAVLWALKDALDPSGTLNPGKKLPAR
ncbi:MAG: FAD-binding oxidoreductase [Solirubrobacteraceae bacterium]